jgi:hypothetical protein
MKKEKRITEPPHFLSGWKEIANYLGKGVRTVQRYEMELGLPVRRPAGKARASVVATRPELDAWVEASPIRSEFRLLRAVPEYSRSACSTLRSGMKEMARLRTQMEDLRHDLRASVKLLHEGICNLWGGVYKEWDAKIPGSPLNRQARPEDAFEFFEAARNGSKDRKAS